jgi:hypothetical protein
MKLVELELKDLFELKDSIQMKFFSELFQVLINKFINMDSIAITYWFDMNPDRVHWNVFLKKMTELGWIDSQVGQKKNWVDVNLVESKVMEYITEEELVQLRLDKGYKKYMLQSPEKSKYSLEGEDKKYTPNLMKTVKGLKEVDNHMYGFARTASTKWQYDVKAIQQNYKLCLSETVKGMLKTVKQYPQIHQNKANYGEVSRLILENLVENPDGTYVSGQNRLDPRLRNSHGCLSKVFNPIGYKAARAVLVIPEENRNTMTNEGLINVYLFIAELIGFKSGTLEEKIELGRRSYYAKDLAHDEVENIWLRRLYAELDKYLKVGMNKRIFMKRYLSEPKAELVETIEILNIDKDYKWSVPIEID